MKATAFHCYAVIPLDFPREAASNSNSYRAHEKVQDMRLSGLAILGFRVAGLGVIPAAGSWNPVTTYSGAYSLTCQWTGPEDHRIKGPELHQDRATSLQKKAGPPTICVQKIMLSIKQKPESIKNHLMPFLFPKNPQHLCRATQSCNHSQSGKTSSGSSKVAFFSGNGMAFKRAGRLRISMAEDQEI